MRTVKSICAMLILALLPAASRAGAPAVVGLEIGTAAARALPADFAGLSYETRCLLCDGKEPRYFRPGNRPLAAMFKTLGVRSLRVGGNTVDRPGVRIPEGEDLDALFGFAKEAGAKVIHTLRLRGGDPERSGELAGYIWSRHREQLTGFAVGNEPNVFSPDYQKFLAAWKTHQQAVLRAAPGAKFCGPAATAGRGAWVKDFAADLAGTGCLALATYHFYPGGNADLVKDPAKGRADMLSPEWVRHYQRMADAFVPDLARSGVGFRIQEANSYWNGGAKDVSDTHAAAIWAIDYLWWWASRGASGISFHTGDTVAKRETNVPCQYAVFRSAEGGYAAMPIAYALLAFDAGSGGGEGRFAPVEVRRNADEINLTAYAVQTPGATLLTVVNKEIGERARTATVAFTARGEVRLLRLESPAKDPASRESRVGGAAIHNDGTWSGAWSDNGPHTGHAEVELPPTTAVVIRISHP